MKLHRLPHAHVVANGDRSHFWISANDVLDEKIAGLELLAVALLAAFFWVEAHVDEPILPLEIFRNRTFSVAGGLAFLSGMGLFGVIVFLPVYLQIVKGLSPTESGLATLPLMAGLLIASISSGMIFARYGQGVYYLMAAMALSGGVIMWLARHRLNESVNHPHSAASGG